MGPLASKVHTASFNRRKIPVWKWAVSGPVPAYAWKEMLKHGPEEDYPSEIIPVDLLTSAVYPS
jgi:hypothetical protein